MTGPRGGGPGVSCAWVSARIEPYVLGDLGPADHAAARAHLEECGACREALRRVEPLMVFAELAHPERPAAAWDGFWEKIQSALPDQSGQEPAAPARVLEWQPPRSTNGTRRHAAMWLAAAAALVLLVSAWALVIRFEGEGAGGAGREAAPLVASHPAALPAGTPLPQTVELVNTPGARPVQIFSMAYGPESAERQSPAAPGEVVTELVLIVDAGLEL